MNNLLTETIEKMNLAQQRPEDIIFIGSRNGEYRCTWDEFRTLADHDYDDSYGDTEVAEDLVVRFQNGGWLERWQYDGSEGWTYRAPFVTPTQTKPIQRLMEDDDHHSNATLAKLHTTTSDEPED